MFRHLGLVDGLINSCFDVFLYASEGVETEWFFIYQTSNAKITKIIQIVISFVYKATFIALFVPVLYPILYIAIGYPSPDLWFTPYGIENL